MLMHPVEAARIVRSSPAKVLCLRAVQRTGILSAVKFELNRLKRA